MYCLWVHKHLTQLMVQDIGQAVVVVAMTLRMASSKETIYS